MKYVRFEKMGKKISFIDLFAGIGGFHYALHKCGANCVFASEWDENCRKTYLENYQNISPDIFNTLLVDSLFAGDITKVSPKSIPNHDVLCAGFPCQPFSVSGKQKGFADTRGTLFFYILKIIKEKQPKVVFLENVKQLFYHDGGQTLKVILRELEQLGYQTSFKILNAKDFGTAQNRERIIIVASKDKKFDFSKVKHSDKQMVIRDILDETGDFQYLKPEEYTILPKELWKKQDSGLIFCGYRNKKIRQKAVRENTNHLSRVHKQPNRIYFIDGTHPTLPSQESSGRFFIYDGQKVRKLTIDECYKLQGFPKTFKKSTILSACYNQIGNSVAIPMIIAVFEEIKDQLL